MDLPIRVRGQVTYRRAVSKKLVFYDVLCRPSSSDGAVDDSCDLWLEVVVKADVFGSPQEVKDIRDRLKLGDIVEVEGRYESQNVMQATGLHICQTWQDRNSGSAFAPQPSPLHRQHAIDSNKPAAQEQKQEQVDHSRVPCAAGFTVIEQQLQRHADPVQESESCATEQTAAVVQQPQLAVCKFWVNTGRCAKGSACPYAHLTSTALRPSKGAWLQARQQRRQVLSSALGYIHSDSAAFKSQRAQHFAAWLIKTYGREALNSGSGVLDVAGGAGAMTYELSVIHVIRCTLVDPRQLKLNKQQRKQLKQSGFGAELAVWTAENLLSEQDIQCDVVQLHPQIPCNAEGAEGGGAVSEQHSTTKDVVVNGNVRFQQVQGLFGPELWRSSRWQQLVGNCSVVIGLHPDQATEPIVDYALETSKPFAVMPCCVFPRLFPNRHLVRGDESVPVVTYSDFIEYIITKGQAQRQILDFEGANSVVFRN